MSSRKIATSPMVVATAGALPTAVAATAVTLVGVTAMVEIGEYKDEKGKVKEFPFSK